MNLTPNQQSVLFALTTEWQTPIQITDRLQKANADLSNVNHLIKNLMYEGLVQANPVILGMYRLTSKGTATRAVLLGE